MQKTKSKAQVMFADLGLELSTAVNIFLRKMLYEGRIPFSITREIPNKTALEAMEGICSILPKSTRSMTV